jgi:hypothetical protein
MSDVDGTLDVHAQKDSYVVLSLNDGREVKADWYFDLRDAEEMAKVRDGCLYALRVPNKPSYSLRQQQRQAFLDQAAIAIMGAVAACPPARGIDTDDVAKWSWSIAKALLDARIELEE